MMAEKKAMKWQPKGDARRRGASAGGDLESLPPPTPSQKRSDIPSSGSGEGYELDEALLKLSKWASDEELSSDPAVVRLSTGLKSRQNLSMWAMKDIDSFLPPPRSRERASWTQGVRLLLFLRNVAVFLPIVVTWRAISLASSAFATFAGLIPEGEDVNFLRYWQTGGVGLLPGVDLPGAAIVPPIDRLSAVAATAASIIGAIIVLTIVAEALTWSERNYRSKHQQQADQERIEVVLELEAALHGYRQATPTSITESLAESLGALLEAARQLQVTAKELEGSTRGVSDLGPAIAGFTKQLASAEERFSTELGPSLSELAKTVDAISGKIGASYDQTLQKSLVGLETLSGTMEEMLQRMQATSATVEIGMKLLKEDLDHIITRVGRLA
jgi:hypothetical protein